VRTFRALAVGALATAVIIAILSLLTGCVVEPIGPYGYGHERPYYSGWRY
jgi:hypothetical protein